MPLIDRPMLSTIECSEAGGMIAWMAACNFVDAGLLDPRPGRSARVQRDLRTFDWRKEIAPEVRREAERAQNRDHEASDEEPVRPRRLGAGVGSRPTPLRSAVRIRQLEGQGERIARGLEMRSVTVGRLVGEQEARHRVDQRARGAHRIEAKTAAFAIGRNRNPRTRRA